MIKFLTDIVLWSRFILNKVIVIGAHFRLFVSQFHKDATINLKLFFLNFVLQYCMKISKALYLVMWMRINKRIPTGNITLKHFEYKHSGTIVKLFGSTLPKHKLCQLQSVLNLIKDMLLNQIVAGFVRKISEQSFKNTL